MAEIKGIKLTGIQSHAGHDGNTLFANVVMDGKKIGTVCDDGWGGGREISIPDDVLKEIKRRHETYIREQKIEDYIATYKMTPEQYLDASGKGAVPLMEADPELFIDELAELTELEKTFKKALKKGWKEVVTVEFVRLAGPQPRDLQFDSDGSEEAIRTIRERADYSARPYRLKRYASLDDFKIA